MARLHEMIGWRLGEDTDAEVAVGTGTDRGPWVAALVALHRPRQRLRLLRSVAVDGRD